MNMFLTILICEQSLQNRSNINSIRRHRLELFSVRNTERCASLHRVCLSVSLKNSPLFLWWLFCWIVTITYMAEIIVWSHLCRHSTLIGSCHSQIKQRLSADVIECTGVKSRESVSKRNQVWSDKHSVPLWVEAIERINEKLLNTIRRTWLYVFLESVACSPSKLCILHKIWMRE